MMNIMQIEMQSHIFSLFTDMNQKHAQQRLWNRYLCSEVKTLKAKSLHLPLLRKIEITTTQIKQRDSKKDKSKKEYSIEPLHGLSMTSPN